jgi:hypothetical protein
MNINLLSAVRRVVSEQGEAILANPARLKGFISDYAKNEPVGDRLTFGRCIESGYYAQFKNTRTDAERRRLKAALLPHLQAASEQSVVICQNTLDLLEAVLFPASAASYNTPAPVMPQESSLNTASTNPVSKKTLLFGIAAGGGCFCRGTYLKRIRNKRRLWDILGHCGACRALGGTARFGYLCRIACRAKPLSQEEN